MTGFKSPPTVGLFTRPPWGFGEDREFEPGEVVRVRRPIPSIVVQSLGSPLPTWASATCFLDDQPDFELDLIYDAPWLGPQASAFPPRLGHFHPQYRLLVVGQKLDPDCARGGALPRADLLVSAVPS